LLSIEVSENAENDQLDRRATPRLHTCSCRDRVWLYLARLRNRRLEKSLRLRLAGLGIRRFDPIAECSELTDHSRGALVLGLFRDGWALWLANCYFSPLPPEHVTLLHFVLGLVRIELVVADSKDIGGG
jgi:hypothetical protein